MSPHAKQLLNKCSTQLDIILRDIRNFLDESTLNGENNDLAMPIAFDLEFRTITLLEKIKNNEIPSQESNSSELKLLHDHHEKITSITDKNKNDKLLNILTKLFKLNSTISQYHTENLNQKKQLNESIRITSTPNRMNTIEEKLEQLELFRQQNQHSIKKLKSFHDHIDETSNQITKLHKEKQELIEGLEKYTKEKSEELSQFSHITSNTITDFNTNIENIKKEFNEKLSELNELLDVASQRTIAGDYSGNADKERKAANLLRIFAILLMLVVVGIFAYALHEAATSDLDLKKAMFRFVVGLFLSVPAAYLSRESAKHREQQNHYQHTSLVLKTIDPYLTSLPEAEQHKLKATLAMQIFTSREHPKHSTDSYPINMHELLVELIKKVDFSKATDKLADKPADKKEQS
ncbi:hypothetical protein [Chitinibacter sp. S2-10]|uniref:hypothetical protein n=1 Tax=Chitinibacter sp. S2-10 TaxID=3373597 RepID=UPI003977AD41